ncbi:MAG: hypothetical protein Q4F66_04275 [Clostridium sp.]|nr:hypothetical protein [Clostridium sp.]
MGQTYVKKILSNMTFKEKCSYIYYYYKFHILIFLMAILFIGFFVYDQSNRKDVYLDITYIGAFVPGDTSDDITDYLNSKLLSDDKSNTIVFDTLDPSNPQTLTKLRASLAAADIDFAIVDQEFFEQNYGTELFADLNSIDGFSSLNLNSDALLKKDDCVYGININSSDILDKINENSDSDNYLVVMSNSKNTDKLIQVLSACSFI